MTVTFSRPPGAGTGLLAFTLWIFVVLLQACWWVAVGLVVGVAVVISALVGWVGDRRKAE